MFLWDVSRNLQTLTFIKLSRTRPLSRGPNHPQVATMVSFESGSRGHVRLPNVTITDNSLNFILRFKTGDPDGLLVYGVDGKSLLTLRMEHGALTFASGDARASTQSARYDDDQWHVVFLEHAEKQPLLLIVDDNEKFKCVGRPAIRWRVCRLPGGGAGRGCVARGSDGRNREKITVRVY